MCKFLLLLHLVFLIFDCLIHLHLLTRKSHLDFLAHLLADNIQSLDNNLQILCGEHMINDNIFGEFLVVFFRLEDMDDDF